jgi:uncharacterized protein
VRRFCLILVLLLGFQLFADEIIPPAPKAYFNDYAGVASAGTAAQLNQTLENFERQTSEQIVVAVFPKMQSDSDIADYTVRLAQAWQVGLKDKNNGAVLFVFVQNHKMFLEVGYGLEGVLPDALCKRILDEQVSPRFKTGDYDGGLTAGVQAILAATKGEYKGNGTTVADSRMRESVAPFIKLGFIVLVVIIIIFARGSGMFLPWLLLSSSGSNRGWGGGGFSGGGGGGGFSGGGGGFGGGGAGGSW